MLPCVVLSRLTHSSSSLLSPHFASVNNLARASCDKLVARLISNIHHISEYWQYCYVGNRHNNADLDCYKTSDFAGDLEDSKSTSKGVLYIFGSHTFVPISWMCKKQTSVSRSSREAEIISLDAGLRMDGIPALTLWDLVIEEFHSAPNRTDGPKKEPRGNPLTVVNSIMRNPIPIKHTNVIATNIDHIPSNTMNSGSSAMLYVLMTMRHVSRTHRVALDWLFDRINLDPKI